jgi:hypothetical protein
MRIKDGAIRCGKSADNFNKSCECTLHMIGFDKNNDILNVCGYDWDIIKINKDGSFEKAGKSDYMLCSIIDNPKLLLQDAKVMSIEDIEKQLGYKVIIKDTERR